MKVKASSFDYTDWNVNPFKPGKLFWKSNFSRKAKVDQWKRIKIKTPCRFDPIVLDLTKLQPTAEENDYKAGALGFAGKLYSQAEIELTENKEIIADNILAEHVAKIMASTTKYEGGFTISTKSHPHRHVGFGSTATLCEAVANGINILLGEPFNKKEIVKFIAHNYGEESEKKKGYLTPGISTGSSGNLVQRGGIGITASDCELVVWDTYPKGTKIIAGIPNVPGVGKGPESSDVDIFSLDWVRHIDRFNAAKVCYWLLMDFAPALKQHDLKKMGTVLYDISFCGTKGAPLIALHGGDLLGIILEMRLAGVEVCFMSSAGPGLVAITKDKANKAREIFKTHKCRVVEIKPDNEGLKYQLFKS
jgi:predicted sugar kinase